MYFVVVVCCFSFLIFVTRDFKIQRPPRFGRDDRVWERSGFSSQQPHPGKGKPGGGVLLDCVVSVQPAQRPVGINTHMAALARVQVEMEMAKFRENRIRNINGR